jgi:hypothetical protein
MASDDVLIFFLSGDKIVDLYNKMYIKNGYSVPFNILSGKHTAGAYKNNGKDVFGIDITDVVSNNNANEDCKTIISNFWMLVPEMKIEFDDKGILLQLINKMNLLIPIGGLNKVKDMIHFYDDIIVSENAPPNGELYQDKGITYYSDDKLYNNMQYFIVPNTDIDGLKENIQPSLTKNTNINPCNITCKFINIDILQQNNINEYTQLFTSGKITKVFIGDDFFDKAINNQILSNLLTEQQIKQNNTPEVILLPCLYKENSTNNCADSMGGISEVCTIFNDKAINTELYTNFYGNDIVRKPTTLTSNYNNREHCRDNTIIGIVLDNFYSNINDPVNRIGYGGRRKSTRKTKKTRKPRKKSRKSRKQKKSRKH